jgi:branched-chain amino acid transport system permease protein
MDVLIYGLVNSAVLALIAVGFTLVYGISRLANFAHGAIYVLTGFMAWVFFRKFGLNYALAIFLALIIAALVGALIYRALLVRVRGLEASEIIGSFAVGLVIMEGLRWKGFIGHGFAIPVFVKGMVEISWVPVDLQRIIIIALGLVIVIFLWLFTHYTRLGLALRAIAQDEQAAMMLGMDSDLMATISLSMGAAFAGLAAVAVLPLGNLNIESGYSVLINAVAVCIVGGLGSWPGAVIAAFLLGYIQILTEVLIASHYQAVVAMAAIILTLILRPSGLFGKQKELEERV